MGMYISRIWGEETPDYEMVHSEVYLNLYVVSIALFSCLPWFLSKYNINIIMSSEIQKTAIFCMFSLFYLSSIFPGESADPICPYVRTPMDRGKTSHEGAGEAEPRPRRAKNCLQERQLPRGLHHWSPVPIMSALKSNFSINLSKRALNELTVSAFTTKIFF